MIVVRLCGGLGNQMFQYAMGMGLSRRYNKKLVLDLSGFKHDDLRDYELCLFNISNNIEYKSSNNIFFNLLRRANILKFFPDYYLERGFGYDSNIIVKEKLYLEGYFQSEKYFQFIRAELLREFSISKDLSPNTLKTQDCILSSRNSVSLHIRRGDFISNYKTKSFHGNLSVEYYDRAIQFIESKVSAINLFIFSDDIEWAKNNIRHKNTFFVENNKEKICHEDIYLMSLCDSNIIANSTFSWWGAWLNKNPDKIIIAPKKWFNDQSIRTDDLIPEFWKRL
jgi:hypothetical protein